MSEEFLSPREQDTTDNLCASCIGACCMANTVIELTSAEAEHLRNAGTVLSPLDRRDVKRMSHGAVRTHRGLTHFVMETNCGYRDPEAGSCTDYEDRPQICRDFPEDGPVCHQMRDARLPQVPIDLPMPTIRLAS